MCLLLTLTPESSETLRGGGEESLLCCQLSPVVGADPNIANPSHLPLYYNMGHNIFLLPDIQ